jgi:hypothetical protein
MNGQIVAATPTAPMAGQNQKIASRLAGMCSADIVLRQIGHSTLFISQPPVRHGHSRKLYS